MTHITHLYNDWIYCDYVKNRQASPSILPESWRKVYGPEAELLEAKYQAELAIAKAAA
jgi:hypothetical protein